MKTLFATSTIAELRDMKQPLKPKVETREVPKPTELRYKTHFYHKAVIDMALVTQA